MQHLPDVDPTTLAEFCTRHRIRRLSLFGSQATGTAHPDSDIDLLVEFEPEAVPGFLGLARISTQLSALAGGRLIDLRTPEDLSLHFRDEVIRRAEVVFAR
jgi:predicted nucleotidyltransferase